MTAARWVSRLQLVIARYPDPNTASIELVHVLLGYLWGFGPPGLGLLGHLGPAEMHWLTCASERWHQEFERPDWLHTPPSRMP